MSGIGVTGRKRTPPQSYCAQLYYAMKQVYEWRFYFVITRDLEATNMVVREHYGHDAMQLTMRVRFEHSEITLDIPEEGLVTKEGWRITPLTTPTISREDVDKYKPGQWIPQCELLVQWEREDQRPAHLRHKVDLIGAKPPFNYIRLNLNPAMEGGKTERTPSKPQLKDLMDALYHKVADKWRMIGLYLKIPKGKLAGIAEKCQDDPHSCLVAMLETWLERVDPPTTWVAIIDTVEFLGEEQLGKELREKYLHDSDVQQTTSTSLVPARVPSLQSASGIKELDEEDHTEITYYLTTLDKAHIYHLALVLGLSEHRAESMKESATFLDDVVVAWLQKTDQVMKKGVPTWQRLVEALKDKTVGQNGIASTIAMDKLLK